MDEISKACEAQGVNMDTASNDEIFEAVYVDQYANATPEAVKTWISFIYGVTLSNYTHVVTEYCQNCETEVELFWDTKRDGYQAYCPHCGRQLMLCDECLHADDNISCKTCDYHCGKTGKMVALGGISII